MLRLSLSGERDARQRYDRLGTAARDISPALREIRRAWLASNRRTFATRGGGRWAPLAPATVARKRRQGLPRTPLVGRERRLLAELSRAPSIDQIGRTRLRVGTPDRLAIFHHEGRGVPRRRLVELPPTFERDALRALARHLRGAP